MSNGLDGIKKLEHACETMASLLERASNDFLSAASAVSGILEALRSVKSTETAKELAEKMAPGFDRLQRMLTSAAKKMGNIPSFDGSTGDRILLG